MQLEEYKKKLEEALTAPLDVDSPDNLYKQVAVIESLSYLALKLQGEAERKATKAEARMRQSGKFIADYRGTAADRKIKWEADCAPLYEEAENARSDARYWASVNKAIQYKVSLCQSILSSITASIKAGIR